MTAGRYLIFPIVGPMTALFAQTILGEAHALAFEGASLADVLDARLHFEGVLGRLPLLTTLVFLAVPTLASAYLTEMAASDPPVSAPTRCALTLAALFFISPMTWVMACVGGQSWSDGLILGGGASAAALGVCLLLTQINGEPKLVASFD